MTAASSDGIEVVVPRVPSHDRLVPQRIADSLDEVRLMLRDREGDRAEHCNTRQGDEETPHEVSFWSSVMDCELRHEACDPCIEILEAFRC